MLFFKVGEFVINLEDVSAFRFFRNNMGAACTISMRSAPGGDYVLSNEEAEKVEFYMTRVSQGVHNLDKMWENREEIIAALVQIEAARRRRVEEDQAVQQEAQQQPQGNAPGQQAPLGGGNVQASIPPLGIGPRTVVLGKVPPGWDVLKGGKGEKSD